MSKMHYSLSLLAFSASALAVTAHAGNAFRAPANDIPDVCKTPDPTRVQIVHSPKNPNWFFRSFPTTNKVSFASDDGSYILDMDTNQTYQVPGPYDPVPIGEEIMTVPLSPLTAYSVAQIMQLNDRAQVSTIANLQIGGVYQSIGQLPSVNGNNRYRAVTDQDRASYIDMEYTPGHPETLHTVGSVKKTCTNVDFTLPMLSKDGSEIAGFDSTSNTTKVWKLNEDGTCTEKLDLGFPTGKADFSFDNNKLVFHVTGSGADQNSYFTHTSGTDARDVYTYDRTTKKLAKISQNVTDSAYYPVWRKDGKIVYVNVDNDGNASFVKADPSKAASTISLDNVNCPTCTSNSAALAIGRTWYDLCHNVANANQPSALVTALSLDTDQCKKLVDQYWDSAHDYQAKYGSDLTKDVLLAACPTAQVTNSAGTVTGTNGGPLNGQQIAMTSCAHCHAPGRPQVYSQVGHRKIGPWDFAHPATISHADKNKMRTFINPDPDGNISMPPANDVPLPQSQIDTLSAWLRAN